MLVRLAIAIAVLALPAPAWAAHRLDTGIQDPLDSHFRETDPGNAFGAARAQGITFVRVPVAWSTRAPTAPASARDPDDPAYRWDGLDRRLAAIRSAGMEPLPFLYSPPAWAKITVGGRPLKAPVVGDFAAFAAAAAHRYDGTTSGLPRVRYWQIWNEPNLAVYLSRRRAAERYRSMVNAAYAEIHGAASDNVVVAGGLAPFGVPPESAISPLRFMRRMLCMSGRARPRPSCGARSSFDVWAHHPYTSGGPNHHAFAADDVSLGDLPEMRRLLLAARRAGHVRPDGRVPFWATEFSWDTKPPDDFGVPVRRHGRWVAEAMYRMWSSGVSMVVWFQLRDIPSTGRQFGQFGQAGLFFRTSTHYANEREKPAARAFRFPFVAIPSGSRVVLWGRTPDSEAGAVRIEQRAGRRWIRVAALRANSHGIFSSRAAGLGGEVLRARVGRARSLPFKAVPTRDVPVNAFGHGPPPG